MSDTTLAYDRGPKLHKYAERGVCEVWIVNLRADLIEQFREPHPQGYRASRQYRAGETIEVAVFADESLSVEELIG